MSLCTLVRQAIVIVFRYKMHSMIVFKIPLSFRYTCTEILTDQSGSYTLSTEDNEGGTFYFACV